MASDPEQDAVGERPIDRSETEAQAPAAEQSAAPAAPGGPKVKPPKKKPQKGTRRPPDAISNQEAKAQAAAAATTAAVATPEGGVAPPPPAPEAPGNEGTPAPEEPLPGFLGPLQVAYTRLSPSTRSLVDRVLAEPRLAPVIRATRDIAEISVLPLVTIHLRLSATRGNHPFFERVVREWYDSTRKRHRRFPLVRAWDYGVALCPLPRTFDEYFMGIEGSARRNFRKSEKNGYSFRFIDPNEHLFEMHEVVTSTDERQGKMSEELLNAGIRKITDPASTTDDHAYPYFGVFRRMENGSEKLVAYACCLVAGDACMLEHIFGHAKYQQDGIVPMLIIGIAKHLFEKHPKVKFFLFERYYGAGETLRRFKKKLLFNPHRIQWELE
jgi:hypothetical protein